MDRLPLVVAAFAAACGEGAEAPALPPPSRVDAVLAAPVEAAAVTDFCEVHPSPEAAPAFSWPELDSPAAPLTGWSWVNVWATWCGPCVAEMPMLVEWRDKLTGEGVPVDLRFVSVDANAADMRAWEAKHPALPPSVRVARPELLEPWVAGMGGQGGAVLPVHLFVDPERRVRCLRMGAVSEADYAVARKVLGGG